ncbi:hypothetical protein F442_10742 [Phytophthora nicotianae P10297]|uniref:Uncharacterized protein n=1 Tax=Phytophthora nicotianae P10297 TaxID=1317064 RepID=W2Z4Q1_PHYNI|nr:hypothetical protein F442_10742 [Phytophthora nicotianae P10297]
MDLIRFLHQTLGVPNSLHGPFPPNSKKVRSSCLNSIFALQDRCSCSSINQCLTHFEFAMNASIVQRSVSVKILEVQAMHASALSVAPSTCVMVHDVSTRSYGGNEVCRNTPVFMLNR